MAAVSPYPLLLLSTFDNGYLISKKGHYTKTMPLLTRVTPPQSLEPKTLCEGTLVAQTPVAEWSP
jgi:hypothetical protein